MILSLSGCTVHTGTNFETFFVRNDLHKLFAHHSLFV
jgi:hypothetical protein